MRDNPFDGPFKTGGIQPLGDIFKLRDRAGARPRQNTGSSADAEPEPDAMAGSPEAPEEKVKPKVKVVLKNTAWEADKVGFNEEADISVDVKLPEEHAHRTRVEFELFACTPDGPEAISKCEGTVEAGKAKARIPVYIPRFRDEFGERSEERRVGK